jgi:signal transduction histidine kinase
MRTNGHAFVRPTRLGLCLVASLFSLAQAHAQPLDPARYETVSFKAGVAVALMGALWSLYLLRLKQATAHVRERLGAQMEERERIARELHDALLQRFQGITPRMQGVAKNMPAQDPLRKMIDDLLDRADEALRESRQRGRSLHRRATDECELADRLTKRGQGLSHGHASSFALEVVGAPRVLEHTVPDEAYAISNEVLTNAFRHAAASTVEVEVAYDSSALPIRVRADELESTRRYVGRANPATGVSPVWASAPAAFVQI